MTRHRSNREPGGRAWRGRLAALALSFAIHGAAAAAFLLTRDGELPAPGGGIAVKLVASVPGGSAGAQAAADVPAPEPRDAVEAAPKPAAPELAEKPEPETAAPEAPHSTEPAEAEKARAEAPAPEAAPPAQVAPVTPAAEAPAEPPAKPAADPDVARALADAAGPKLADGPSARPEAERAARPRAAAKPEPKPAPKPVARPAAAPDTVRDTGSSGPSGAAADTPETAAVERTAPGFAVGSGANPLPDYPYRARRLGQQGRVVLEVAVSPNGMPVEVRIAESSGHDSLDRAAREAVRRWRFTPARIGGVAVAGSVQVPITFRLTGESGR